MEEGWDAATAELIPWILTLPTPHQPFQLDTVRKVGDPALFFRQLRATITLGPQSFAVDALRADLRLLLGLWRE
jgi:hypothetical protein